MTDERTHILVTGLNHRTAPVELRERIGFGPGRLHDALRGLSQRPCLAEAAILSTCNRAELYVAGPEPHEAGREVRRFLQDFHGLDAAAFEPHLYDHVDEGAARHLFQVAAGLDSMVLGESEILGQVKGAFKEATELGTVRTFLSELFQRGLHVGKVARTDTGIHRGRVSVSSAAVELACNVFGDLKGRQALIVGAGKMSTQTLRHLTESGVASIMVANRTFEKARELAEGHGGEAIRFDEFPQKLATVDIIVSSSAAPHPILTVDKLKPHLAARRGRPLFIIDIAVPRDVEPEVAELPNVYLFDIDDLQSVTERYRREREKEVARVEAVVDQETHRFMGWLAARSVSNVIKDLRAQTEAVRDAELERWLRKMPDLTDEQQDLVRQMMRSFGNKMMHAPLTGIRELCGRTQEADRLWLVRRLFDLDEGEEGS